MKCAACGSYSYRAFPAEVLIHFPGLVNIDKSPVFVFPKITICPECGVGQFRVPEAELRLLMNRDVAAAAEYQKKTAGERVAAAA